MQYNVALNIYICNKFYMIQDRQNVKILPLIYDASRPILKLWIYGQSHSQQRERALVKEVFGYWKQLQ